jgi:hypothetical protein
MSILPNAHHLENIDMALTQTSEVKTLLSSNVRYQSIVHGMETLRFIGMKWWWWCW